MEAYVTQGSHPINESTSGAFWDDMNNTSLLRGTEASQLINQSIIDDYGSAQDITNLISNKIYNTSVK